MKNLLTPYLRIEKHSRDKNEHVKWGKMYHQSFEITRPFLNWRDQKRLVKRVEKHLVKRDFFEALNASSSEIEFFD